MDIDNEDIRTWWIVVLLFWGFAYWLVLILKIGFTSTAYWASFLIWFSMTSGYLLGQKGIKRTLFRKVIERLWLVGVVGGWVATIIMLSAETYLVYFVLIPISLLFAGVGYASLWGFWENPPEVLKKLRKYVLIGVAGVGNAISFLLAIISQLLDSSTFFDLIPFAAILIALGSFVLGAAVVKAQYKREEDTDTQDVRKEGWVEITKELYSTVVAKIEGSGRGYTVDEVAREALRQWINGQEDRSIVRQYDETY